MVDGNLQNYNPDSNTLKELRQRLGWTQSQLAKELGMDEKTIRNYEKGIREPLLKLWQVRTFLDLLSQAGMSTDVLPNRPDV